MKHMNNKNLIIGIFIIFILTSLTSITTGYIIETPNNDTEYWALLIAVGVYASHPKQDRPSMLNDVEDLHEKLLVSTHWKEENIKVIKGKNATLWNIFKGFQWLNQKERDGDFSMVYITTHGGQLSRDFWPWDEKDRQDELLVTYRGFQLPFTNIRDDLLNLFLSILNSKGVCVIVDSCYAGGFNDQPYFKSQTNENKISACKWMEEFADDINRGGRVVLMSCREEELSYAGMFTPLLIEALTGYADTNQDRLVSAEETFVYIEENFPEGIDEMHPTISDGYPGELVLTEVELPPSKPDAPSGQIIGDTNISYNYSTVSIDPEDGKISYGWDWDSNYIVDEWTGPLDSNITVINSHSWAVEGTYNIRVKAKDEFGVLSGWSNHRVVIMCDDNIPDQQQIILGGGIYLPNFWVAQSFVPSLDTLSKIELALDSYGSGDPPPINLYIRDNLYGDNFVEFSRAIPESEYGEHSWFTFDFENLDVVAGKTYYIVCWTERHWGYFWIWNGDCYPHGEVFTSVDGGDHWRVFNPSVDCCFVTWGKI